MTFRIIHRTEYTYSNIVNLCHNIGWLFPQNSSVQNFIRASLFINPTPDYYSERLDFFGNRVTFFSIQKPHKKLSVTMESEVQIIPLANLQLDFNMAGKWENVVQTFKENKKDYMEASQFILGSPLVKTSNDAFLYAKQSFTPNRPVIEATHELMQRIYSDFKFLPGFTNLTTPLEVVFREKKGVCQDFAHFGISCLRSMGIPARYVSGYIETIPPLGKPKLIGSDASHAWFSVFVPLAGWIDFDPTNNQIPGEKHIVLGWGRDYADVAPLKGVIYNSGKQKMDISVDVTSIA